MIRRIVGFEFLPAELDWGLLVLRVAVVFSLFLQHGNDKILDLPPGVSHFSDPLHLGHLATFMIAAISDGFCSLLIIVGLATRWVCAYAFVNILIAWSLGNHFAYCGKNPAAGHGSCRSFTSGYCRPSFLSVLAVTASMQNCSGRRHKQAPPAVECSRVSIAGFDSTRGFAPRFAVAAKSAQRKRETLAAAAGARKRLHSSKKGIQES